MAEPKSRSKDNAAISPTQSTNRKARQRASKACLSCRARKVRCDVSQNGIPCMNCRRDDEKCVVTKRNSRLCIIRVPSQSQDTQSHPHSLEIQGPTGGLISDLHTPAALDPLEIGTPIEAETPLAVNANNTAGPLAKHGTLFGIPATNPNPNPNPTPARCMTEPAKYKDSHVLFHYYPFIDPDGTSCLPLEDFQYLEQIGCFAIPIRPILDEFMRIYFLHVHPHLPILDEGDVWTMYSGQIKNAEGPQRMSLFVMRSLLVAACTYLSATTISELGFASKKDARATYYRQAKALFDMDNERDSLPSAQGSLLLTYHVPLSKPNTNSYWLGLAIHFAKSLGAHLYRSTPYQSDGHRITLKRLWWSCLFRDRILSLGLRRPLQIRSQDFDTSLDSLGEFDFEGEISKSQVHTPLAKRQLAQLTTALCELIGLLTEINTFLYGTPSPKQQNFPSATWDCLKSWLLGLDQWHEKTYTAFLVMTVTEKTHEAVMLYTKVACIYYYSAKAALHSRMILLSAMALGNASNQEHEDSHCLHLESVVRNITESLNELSDNNLLRFVPISIVAYATLPLVWYVLDAKMRSESPTTNNQDHLNIYDKAMKLWQTQYEAIDDVLLHVSKLSNWITMSNTSRLQHPSEKGSPSRSQISHDQNSIGLKHLSNNQPRMYLRATLAVDLILAQGRLPNESEFPTVLQLPSKQPYLPMYNYITEKNRRVTRAKEPRLLEMQPSRTLNSIEEAATSSQTGQKNPVNVVPHDTDLGHFEGYFLAGLEYRELEEALS